MQKFTLFLLSALTPAICMAQAITEKKGVRIYEHHSSAINKGAPFGNDANGSMSGYDFVKHKYHGSFNPATSGKWAAADLENIDFVEHNSRYGGGGGFGITSGTSGIWAGDIKGNGTTMFVAAPASFNYDTMKDVSTIQKSYPATGATNTIASVAVGKVYLCKVRNTNMFVAMKVTGLKNLATGYKSGDTATVYFDFDYKYGTAKSGTSGIDGAVVEHGQFLIMPNPSKNSFEIKNVPSGFRMESAVIRITDMTGRVVYQKPAKAGVIEHGLTAGMYFVTLSNNTVNLLNTLVVVE